MAQRSHPVTTLWACPNSNPKNPNCESRPICTLAAAFHHTTAFCSLPRFLELIVDMGTASSIAPLLSFIFNASSCFSFSFMRVAEPSCLHRCLKCSG